MKEALDTCYHLSIFHNVWVIEQTSLSGDFTKATIDNRVEALSPLLDTTNMTLEQVTAPEYSAQSDRQKTKCSNLSRVSYLFIGMKYVYTYATPDIF